MTSGGWGRDLNYEKYICIKDSNHKLVQSSFSKPQLKPHESHKGSALCWNYEVLFIVSSDHVFVRSVGLLVIVSLPTMIRTEGSCNGDPWRSRALIDSNLARQPDGAILFLKSCTSTLPSSNLNRFQSV